MFLFDIICFNEGLSPHKYSVFLVVINVPFTLTYSPLLRPYLTYLKKTGVIFLFHWDLEAFINESEHGVIYLCLGSLIRAESLPKDKLEVFISVFSELPQRVLWKIDNIPGLPNNVKTSKWFPQFEILSKLHILKHLRTLINTYVI
jgi:UDP:flavonoid glycosyltransferase YjiC (YdhE family)